MYANSSNARTAYVGASITTASPARLLVMLCERLVLDVERGLTAQRDGDHEEAHRQLVHAQDIVTALDSSLRPELFSGGAELSALYQYLLARLVHANIRRDSDATAECLTLSSQISDTWRTAALQAAAV